MYHNLIGDLTKTHRTELSAQAQIERLLKTNQESSKRRLIERLLNKLTSLFAGLARRTRNYA